MVGNLFKLHLEYLKIALSTAMEYKFNFFIQVIGMMLNNLVWIFFWLIFFNNFQVINGWVMADILMLYSIATISFGIGGIFFGNMLNIAKMIAEGKLDFYLVLPKNRLYHILISRSKFYDVGEIIFGIILAGIVLSISQIPLFLLFILTSTIIFIAFGVIINTLGFYMGNAEATSRHLFFGTLTIATYPLSIFKGITKFIILTIIPAGFITGVPVEVLKEFNLFWFSLTIFFSISLLLLSILLFYRGLKKYESGNLLHVRG
jgi:ABC-2 type transport system permease protein